MFDEAMPAVPVTAAPEIQPTPQPAPETETDAKSVNVVVASKVKAVIKGKGLRMDGNLADAINAKVVAMIEEAAEHARADGRATVRPFDLAA
jgi:hypothetical protein